MRRVKRLPQGARRRALAVFGLILAAAIASRHLAERSGGAFTGELARSAREASVVEHGDLPRGARSELLAAARARFDGRSEVGTSGAADVWTSTGESASGERTVLVSLSRPEQTALVAEGRGTSPSDAMHAAIDGLKTRSSAEEYEAGRLKVDLITAVGPHETFDNRGRFEMVAARDGLLLEGAGFDGQGVLLLPEELVSRRLVDEEGDLQRGRLERYLAEGGRQVSELSGNPGQAGMPVRRVTFDSFAEGDGGRATQLFWGNPRSPDLAPDFLLASARAGGDYLLRHQLANGDFDYIYLPRRDETGDGYNLLRHAGTCYALLELYGATRDGRYLTSARRGIEALLTRARGPRPDDSEADFETIVSPGEEAKLGGAALAILAMTGPSDRDSESSR